MSTHQFKTSFAENIFRQKYALSPTDTWPDLAERVVDDVCGTLQGKKENLLGRDDREQLVQYITDMKFVPGGRYLRNAGRALHTWNNCFALRGENDSREEWGNLLHRASDALMSGGGIGVEYSRFRPSGSTLSRTGGKASGPIPLMKSVNDHGRHIMQGGDRRAAIWAGLNWRHTDIPEFLTAKNWQDMPIGKQRRNGKPYTMWDAKTEDFNFQAPLDMTNISVGYDDEWLDLGFAARAANEIFIQNVRQALSTGEPGFSFNFGSQGREDLRNPCCEFTSEDDSDVCNLGSLNLGAIKDAKELIDVTYLATEFLICGTLRADLPYAKVYEIRERNRKIGLGIMGVHEFLMRRGLPYAMTDELRFWLSIYENVSDSVAADLCNTLSISVPKAKRAIAPTGTLGILASTTTGIEPLYAVAYKRRYLTSGSHWKHEFVVDATADHLIREIGLDPDSIDTASALALDPARRISFQADIQDYVDMAISSTINLPAWGTEHNNESKVLPFAKTLAEYAPRLRGFTCYPDGSRGGQPLTQVSYEEAVRNKGVVFDEHDICELTGHGGTCGV